MAVPMIVKTAVGIDVSREYAERTSKDKKPFYLSQRFIGLIVSVLCSTVLAKYTLPADEIESAVNLIISNWDALSAAFGALWSIVLIIKGSLNNKGRKEAEKQVFKDRLAECERPDIASVEDPTGVSPRGD